MKKHKILILKVGYSEILDGEDNSRNVSLGDVFRTTALLELYKNEHVTWVTDSEALPLLENNPLIDRLLVYDFTTVLQLESEEFDTVINLEKIPGICAFADKIKAWRKFGFRFNTLTGKAEAYDNASELLTMTGNLKLKKENPKSAQEILFNVVGKQWNGEEYILGYKPRTQEQYDVGFNILVGHKWPTKSWPIENWDKLETILKERGLTVTRQDKQPKEVLTNLNYYIDWLNSCKVIVSNDSLGMHLSIALKKQVIGLFGPTSWKEVHFYGRGKAIYPDILSNCIPCFNKNCERGRNCMKDISVERVYDELNKILMNT